MEQIVQVANLESIEIQKLNCQQGKPVTRLCCSSKCSQSGLLCSDQKCKCNSQTHRQCSSLIIQHIVQEISARKRETPQIVLESFQALDKIIENMLEELSIIRENVKQQKDNYRLEQSTIQFLVLLNGREPEKIDGKLVSSIRGQLSQPKHFQYVTEEEINIMWETQKQTFDKLCCWLKLIRSKQTASSQLNAKNTSTKDINAKQADSKQLIVKEISGKQVVGKNRTKSNIIQEFSLPYNWIRGSKGKEVKNHRLLYRASQNQFSVARFHQLCDGIPNTLTIIRTEFGKIIGGFHPGKWVSDTEGHYNQTKAFIFSITMREKMKSNYIANTAFCYSVYGPTFGLGHDLCVADKSNVLQSCFSNFPTTFNFQGKYKDNQEAKTLFTGNPSGNKFKTEEWEVFQVIY